MATMFEMMAKGVRVTVALGVDAAESAGCTLGLNYDWDSSCDADLTPDQCDELAAALMQAAREKRAKDAEAKVTP